mmetsp:Transcript_84341/g.272668  ORF Transcript_84341/g.272668 Transcript_84341/m.272668 type:complete len:92 (+) Transcript_84341:2762-3037(+)
MHRNDGNARLLVEAVSPKEFSGHPDCALGGTGRVLGVSAASINSDPIVAELRLRRCRSELPAMFKKNMSSRACRPRPRPLSAGCRMALHVV